MKQTLLRTTPHGWLIVTGLLVAAAALAGCQPIQPASIPGIAVTVTSPTDQAMIADADGMAVVHITSTSGIGGAQLTFAPSDSTQPVLLRFHLAGLEELRLRGGETTFTVAVASTPPHAVSETLQVNAETSPVSLTPESDEWTPVQIVSHHAPGEASIPIHDGYIDVLLPPALVAAGDGHVQLDWIDFFR